MSVHVGRIERATERREARKTPLLAESHRMQQVSPLFLQNKPLSSLFDTLFRPF